MRTLTQIVHDSIEQWAKAEQLSLTESQRINLTALIMKSGRPHDGPEDLVNRLRGIYTVSVNDGAGLLDGKDTFTRHFVTPPIQLEAADRIATLEKELAEANASLTATF